MSVKGNKKGAGLRQCVYHESTIRGVSLVLCLALIAATLMSRAPQRNVSAQGNAGPPRREGHALWAIPSDAGKTVESVRQFVNQCKHANIDIIVMDVKDSNGGIYWRSHRFPQAIAKGYESFDLVDNLTREAHAQGIKVHAWFVDFLEGANSPAFREHPEWAELNPDGGTTLTEKLGTTRQYPYVWMCPARRPGYVDQWLLPLFEEIAANYQIDGVHHDYVRYPGDVAPDSYCFCDYCLAHIPRYAMLSYETRADERYRVRPAQPRIEANWWSDPTMLPADWGQRDRREKADYLLNGRTIPGGPPDMRYYFYDYRAHQIETFVREVTEHVKRINPKIEVSAAVFKNPITSGRFLGQHWDQWNDWIDIYMPMTYRSHFAGSFDAYLDHLAEITARQMDWVGHKKPIYAGIASTYLYREEMQPLDDIRNLLDEWKAVPATEQGARAEKARLVSTNYALMRQRLAQAAPESEREISALIITVTANDGRDATPEAINNLADKMLKLRTSLPPGYLPPEKLIRAVEAARKANPEGIVIFAGINLTTEKLWPALETAFKR